MNPNEKGIDEIIGLLALQHATDTAVTGFDHGSKICHVERGSWQADVIQKTAEIRLAKNPTDLRAAMQDPTRHVIFIPADAVLPRNVVDRICAESPLNKTVILERESS
jgi:hypothetical protein